MKFVAVVFALVAASAVAFTPARSARSAVRMAADQPKVSRRDVFGQMAAGLLAVAGESYGGRASKRGGGGGSKYILVDPPTRVQIKIDVYIAHTHARARTHAHTHNTHNSL